METLGPLVSSLLGRCQSPSSKHALVCASANVEWGAQLIPLNIRALTAVLAGGTGMASPQLQAVVADAESSAHAHLVHTHAHKHERFVHTKCKQGKSKASNSHTKHTHTSTHAHARRGCCCLGGTHCAYSKPF